MTNYQLKLVGLVTMVIDHLGVIWGIGWFRIIGRAALPAFALGIGDSVQHTSDKSGYVMRLLGLGLVSQVPYQLLFGKQELNVIFTLLFGVLLCLDGWLGFILIVVGLAVEFNGDLEVFGRLDYGLFGMLLPFFIQQQQSKKDSFLRWGWLGLIGLLYWWRSLSYGWICWISLGFLLVFIRLYSHERGRGSRWIGYVYPIHLVVIWSLKYVFSFVSI